MRRGLGLAVVSVEEARAAYAVAGLLMSQDELYHLSGRTAVPRWECFVCTYDARQADAASLAYDLAVAEASRSRLHAPRTALTRSVLLGSQPITAGDSTSDREARNATALSKPGQAIHGGAGPECVNTATSHGASGSTGCKAAPRALPTTSRATTRR